MKRLVLICLLLCAAGVTQLSAQGISAWYGEWKGMLDLYKADGTIERSIPMVILIEPTNDSLVAKWRITYNEADTRIYLLKTKDAAKGQYVLEEKNGMLIELRRFGKVLLSNYEVQDFQINTTYELTGMTIQYTLVSSNTKLHSQSGQGTKEVPYLKSMPPNVYQRGSLIRQ